LLTGAFDHKLLFVIHSRVDDRVAALLLSNAIEITHNPEKLKSPSIFQSTIALANSPGYFF